MSVNVYECSSHTISLWCWQPSKKEVNAVFFFLLRCQYLSSNWWHCLYIYKLQYNCQSFLLCWVRDINLLPFSKSKLCRVVMECVLKAVWSVTFCTSYLWYYIRNHDDQRIWIFWQLFSIIESYAFLSSRQWKWESIFSKILSRMCSIFCRWYGDRKFD